MAATAHPIPGTETRVYRALRVVILVLAAGYAAMLVYHVAASVVFPYDLDYGEGYVLNDALRLTRGEPLYTDIRRFPMVRSPYPPGFLLLDGALTRALGGGFAAGRALAGLSALAVAGLVYAGARRLAGRNLVALACAGLSLGSPFLYQWAGYARVDLLANALSIAAVVTVLFGLGWRRLGLAATLCVLALLTKQTSLAAPAAIAMALALGNPRKALAFAVLVAAPTAAVTIALNLATDGQYWQHVWIGNAGNPFNLGRMALMELEFLLPHVLLAGTALLTVGLIRRVSDGDHGQRVASLYAAAAFATSLSIGNEGSSVNYLLEFLGAAALAMPVAWRAIEARIADPEARAAAPLMLVAWQLALYAHVPNVFGVWPAFFPPHGFTPTAADYAVGARLDAFVRETPGPILAEPAGLAVRNGKQVLVQPIDLRAEQHRGRWQPDELNRAIAEHRFGLIVLSFRLLPEEVLQEIARSYRLVEYLEGENRIGYAVYAPQVQA